MAGTGIKCPTDCTETYAEGTVVTLTATPAGGSFFDQWTGDCLSMPNPCVLTMDGDKSVDAVFELSPPSPSPSALIDAIPSVAWSTQLEVPGGEGQVVMNGRVGYAVREGLAELTAERHRGANRVEGVLVRGAGRPGTWRFDFSGQAAFRPGSLRVVAGTAAMITGDSVVFRLEGKPGERLVFVFEVE